MTIEIKTLMDEVKAKTEALRSEIDGVKGEDVLTKSKIAKLESDLAESVALKTRVEAMENAMNRADFKSGDKKESEHKSAFIKFLRNADNHSAKNHLQEVESKSVIVGTPANGGYAVPTEISTDIAKIATDTSAMRQLGSVVSVSNENYVELLDNVNAGSGWAGESTERTVTDTPTLTQVKPTYGEVYAIAEVSNHALNDIFFDVESWLVASIAEKFATREGAAFLAGDGVNKPTGILNGTVIGGPASGVAAAFGTNPFDNIIDLKSSVKAEYSNNGKFLMNSTTYATLSKVKDTTGNYILNTNVAAGQNETLVGKPIFIDEAMPSIAAGARPILYGDFARAYLIADLVGMELIVDNVTKKGFHQFYVSRRVGGIVKDANAVKALRIAAS